MKRKLVALFFLIMIGSLVTILRSVEFGNSFSVMKADRKLTKQELIRAIRLMIAAEYEAIQLYMQLAESIDDELVKNVLIKISDEERVHAGEFLRLLKHLEPEEEKHYKEGAKEVDEEISKLVKKGKQ